jgi:hypothetical protein
MSEHNRKFRAGDPLRFRNAPSFKFTFLRYEALTGDVVVKNSIGDVCVLGEKSLEFDLKFKIGDKVNVSKYPFISPWEVVGTLSDGRYVLENRTGAGELYGVTTARESELSLRSPVESFLPVGVYGVENTPVEDPTTLKALRLAREALDLAIERLQNDRH